MTPSITVDLTEFNRALSEYAETSSRSIAEIVAAKAGDMAFKSIFTTYKSDAQIIRQELGEVVITSHTRTGKTRRRREYKRSAADKDARNTLAGRIVLSRIARGMKVKGETIDEMVRNLIAARMRAIAFVRAGWLWAARKASANHAAIRNKERIRQTTAADTRLYGQPKGDARLTSSSFHTFAEIDNSALKQSSFLAQLASKGLQAAIPAIIAEMRARIVARLQEQANKQQPK